MVAGSSILVRATWLTGWTGWVGGRWLLAQPSTMYTGGGCLTFLHCAAPATRYSMGSSRPPYCYSTLQTALALLGQELGLGLRKEAL
jgi:hypothetical protein